ncbi:MAG: hypothetical protein JWQ55_6254 [Rhodopila sp.]|jgi:hypothetical protein|nr:hypothetical protein [Rhodopila sp.]
MKSPYPFALTVLIGVLLSTPAARAAAPVGGPVGAPVAAVFAFELDDTSLQGEISGHDAGDLARLGRLDSQLRDALARSGRYTPVAVPTSPGEPWTCDGCEVDIARKAGAQVSVVGWVQKVSNLILNINVVMRDVQTGQRIQAGSVDIRGDTDESWTHGMSFLINNRILGGQGTR